MIVTYGSKEAGILLGDTIIRNTIIKNATISYSGKPCKLENVYFVNCSFVFQPSPKGIRLIQAFFAAPSTRVTLD